MGEESSAVRISLHITNTQRTVLWDLCNSKISSVSPYREAELAVLHGQKMEACTDPSLCYEHWLCTYFHMISG